MGEDIAKIAAGPSARALVEEIISMYHTTRLSDVPAAVHILSKRSVRDALDVLATTQLPESGVKAGAGERAELIANQVLNRVDNYLARFGGFRAYAAHAENGTTTGWSSLRSTIWLAIRTAALSTPPAEPVARKQCDTTGHRGTCAMCLPDAAPVEDWVMVPRSDLAILAARDDSTGDDAKRWLAAAPQPASTVEGDAQTCKHCRGRGVYMSRDSIGVQHEMECLFCKDPAPERHADLRERYARAMYDSWPHSVISRALAEVTGLPIGTVLTWEAAHQAGADFKGLYRYADAILALLPNTDRLVEALEKVATGKGRKPSDGTAKQIARAALAGLAKGEGK